MRYCLSLQLARQTHENETCVEFWSRNPRLFSNRQFIRRILYFWHHFQVVLSCTRGLGYDDWAAYPVMCWYIGRQLRERSRKLDYQENSVALFYSFGLRHTFEHTFYRRRLRGNAAPQMKPSNGAHGSHFVWPCSFLLSVDVTCIQMSMLNWKAKRDILSTKGRSNKEKLLMSPDVASF